MEIEGERSAERGTITNVEEETAETLEQDVNMNG